jgi:hypothetical protein
MRKRLALGVVAAAFVSLLLPLSFRSQVFTLEGVVVDAGTNAPLRKAVSVAWRCRKQSPMAKAVPPKHHAGYTVMQPATDTSQYGRRR